MEQPQDLVEILKSTVPLESNQFTLKKIEGSVESWKAEFSCGISSQEEIETFVNDYAVTNGETLKLKLKKPSTPKSLFKVRSIYRCHHDTRYEKTRDAQVNLWKKPSKRFQNTYCPFQMIFKVLKPEFSLQNEYPCIVYIEKSHNHPTQSLEATSFKDLTDSVKERVNGLFEIGMSPSLAYKEFLQNLRAECEDELIFHKQKADRSLCPRRRDFNFLYSQYCRDKFGGKNGTEMFKNMETRINSYLEENKDSKIKYQLFDGPLEQPLIISIMTPLMCRVHEMVRLLLTFLYTLK